MKTFYGYMRVSTKEQNEDRQRIKLKEAGIEDEKLFLDKQSGKDFNRKNYKKLLERLDSKSVLFVTSIDRLGRNYSEIMQQWKIITQEKKADIVVLDMPLLDTRKHKDLLGTLISDIVLSLLSYVAETERTFIRERQREGIAAAHIRGVKFGRPKIKLTEIFYNKCAPLEGPRDFPERSREELRHGKVDILGQGEGGVRKPVGLRTPSFYRNAIRQNQEYPSKCILGIL